jgi:hypothetical protein
MLRDYRAVRTVASAIAEAVDETIDAYRSRRVVGSAREIGSRPRIGIYPSGILVH